VEPIDAQLAQLLELQRSDHRVRKVEHQLDGLAEQQVLEAAEGRARELTDAEHDLAGQLERAEADGTTLDRDIGVLTSRRDHERVRLYDGSVTNQREMSSVEAEIESTDRRIEEHEEDLLVVLEHAEELERRRAAVQADLQAAREAAAEAEEARDAIARGLLAELGEAKAARDREAAALPDELRDRYEAAAQRGGGTAVGELDRGSCTACRIDFSMVEVDQLYRGASLTTCPQCRRLLVVT
jgi:predicted  nucleic acid-binding Zn-ribbon protein